MCIGFIGFYVVLCLFATTVEGPYSQGVTIAMVTRSYTRSELLDIGVSSGLRVSSYAYRRITELGIKNASIRPTHRSIKASQHQSRTIAVRITSRHQSELCPESQPAVHNTHTSGVNKLNLVCLGNQVSDIPTRVTSRPEQPINHNQLIRDTGESLVRIKTAPAKAAYSLSHLKVGCLNCKSVKNKATLFSDLIN